MTAADPREAEHWRGWSSRWSGSSTSPSQAWALVGTARRHRGDLTGADWAFQQAQARRKHSPAPVTEPLKAERIQELLRAMPEWRVSAVQIAGGAVTLTTAKTARGLTKEELELAAGLEKVA